MIGYLSRTALLFGLMIFSLSAQSAAVDSLRGFYARTTTMHTSFVQKVLDEKGAVSDVLRGQFWLSRPTRFRWEYSEPYEQVMVNDGNKLWLYDVDLDQVTVRNASEALAGAPVWLLNGGPALDEQFVLESEAMADGLEWVRMIPREEGGDFRLARMGLRQGLPEVLELTDALGQKTIIRFEGLSVNTVIPDSRFIFSIPKGVEVVEG